MHVHTFGRSFRPSYGQLEVVRRQNVAHRRLLHGWWNQALAPLNAKQHEIKKAGLSFAITGD